LELKACCYCSMNTSAVCRHSFIAPDAFVERILGVEIQKVVRLRPRTFSYEVLSIQCA
jgi:hypothetical protein